MTPVFTARRRAEDFNTLVEQGPTAASGTRFDEQLALVAAMQDLTQPEPSPAFTADLRERLLAAADELLAPTDVAARLTLPPRRTARERLVAGAVGGLAVVGATTSLAVASQSALPGDMLYPLKRALESAETQLHASDRARGESMLVHATDRLDEATELSRGGDLSEGENVAQALVDFAGQATTASDLLLADQQQSGSDAGVRSLLGFTESSMQTLVELQAMAPAEARDELRYAVQTLDEIDDAAQRACPSCPGGIDQIPSVLLSAGAVAEPNLVVVPDTVPGEARSGTDGTSGGESGSGGNGSSRDGSTTLPEVDLGDTAGTGSATGDDGPLQGLTDGLTGTLEGSTSGGGGGTGGTDDGLTGVPEVDDTVDDTVDGLVDGVDDTVDGTVDDLDDSLPDLP